MFTCAIALVLLMDGSSSVSDSAWANQTISTAEALRHDTVAHVIDSLPGGAAVVAVSFATNPSVVVPWMLLKTKEDILKFSAQLKEIPRGKIGYFTNIPAALEKAETLFADAPCNPENKTVDISTDGMVTNFQEVEKVRDSFVLKNIRLNAIGFGFAPGLEDFLNDSLKTPNGFAGVAETMEDYALAIRRKIIMEISAK